MNQNKNVIWIAAIGVAVVLLVAYLLSKPPAGSVPLNPIATTSAPDFPEGTPPLAPAVPVLPPEDAAPAAPPEIPAQPDTPPAPPADPERQ